MSEDSKPSTQGERFEALALPHLDAAFNLARWLSRNDQDASDIVQEAFMRAFQAFAGLRGDNARPWLLAIVRNTSFTWMARHRADILNVPYEEESLATADDSFDPELCALRLDDQRRVDAAIERLPIEFREVVVLRELEDLSYKEIAALMSIPVGTVMSRLARARRLLARYLSNGAGGG